METILDEGELQHLSGLIVHEMYQVYFKYGPGIFEKVYEAALAGRLRRAGLRVERQKTIAITDDFVHNEPAFVADLVVEGHVIVEIKSVEKLSPVAFKQLRSYLRLTGLTLGLLVNFNTNFLKSSIHRVANNY